MTLVSRYLPSRHAQQQRQQALPAADPVRDLGYARRHRSAVCARPFHAIPRRDRAGTQPTLARSRLVSGHVIGPQDRLVVGGTTWAMDGDRSVARSRRSAHSCARRCELGRAGGRLCGSQGRVQSADDGVSRPDACQFLGWGIAVAIAVVLAIGLNSRRRLWRVLFPDCRARSSSWPALEPIR